MNKYISKCISAVILLASSTLAIAEPFDSCPADGFLIQGSKIPSLYTVDLSSGDYKLLGQLASTSSVNAIGYNMHDDYIYGWSKEYLHMVKIHRDLSFETLTVIDKPIDKNIYVGDVSPLENIYFFYHPSIGFYKVSLETSDSNYLKAIKVIDKSVFNQSIYDIAINPSNGFAYSVDRSGNLYQIDLTVDSMNESASTKLGNVGQSGTFGAVYFDSNENLYISNNRSGQIFRIDINSNNPTAELFANGPASSSNDGARCTSASIINTSVATLDFGDAPDTYGTSCDDGCDSNGARHLVDENGLFLGSSVNAEVEAYLPPLSDNKQNGSGTSTNEEEGIEFVTSISIQQKNVVKITSSGNGFVSAWIDWDRNGTFDNDDKIITDEPVTEGDNYVTYEATTPNNAVEGETWSRFRLSTSTGLDATGGAPDGEVEDYEVTIINQGDTSFYPSQNSFVTLAFEDNWPELGDYDMNDVVMQYRTSMSHKNGEVTQISLQGRLTAAGGSYHHGFAIHIPGVDKNKVDESGIYFSINGEIQLFSPIETDNTDLVFVVTTDIKDYTSSDNCSYFRTEVDCDAPINNTLEWKIGVPFKTDDLPQVSSFPAQPFDPFIFATDGHYHGDFIPNTVGISPGRGLEIHLKNKPVTALFNEAYFLIGDDASNSSLGHTFQTANGMPWALEIADSWSHPYEHVDLLDAYPKFKQFVESSGSNNTTWYLQENSNSNFIYQ